MRVTVTFGVAETLFLGHVTVTKFIRAFSI